MDDSAATGVRTGVPDDLAEVQRLNAALYEFENGRGFYQDSYDLTWTHGASGTAYFRGLLDPQEGGVAFVAESGGRAVGYLAGSARSYVYRSANPIAEIENMFVEDAWRGRGLGTALVGAFRAWAHEQGVCRLKVGAFAGNASALGFYRSCGFTDMETFLERPV